MTITRRTLLAATAALAMAASFGAAHAGEVTLNIGYQPIVEPSRVPQADKTYESATGADVEWHVFGGGADVIAAIAAGSIDIGYVGSSPLTAAEKQWLGKRVILDDGRAGHVWSLVGPSYVLADPECNIPGARWRRKRVTPVTPYGKPADIAVVVDGELVLARTDQTVFAPPSWGEAVECRINL